MFSNSFVSCLSIGIALLTAPSISFAAPCSTAANWDINAKASDPSVKPLIGSPTSDILLTPAGDGCYRHYQRGSIYWNQQAGTHFVIGAIHGKWSQLGWERGVLRYPVTDELTTPDGRGRYNHFQGGSIYWHPDTGAYEVHGDIRALWSQIGWERSVLGYPVTDETITPDRIGRFNHFQGGSIYWKPNLGPHFIFGAIRNYWASQGYERNSALGYPITNELAPKLGSLDRFQDFENGVLFWKKDSRTAAELGRFPLASRDRADLELEAQNKVAGLMAPYGDKAYIDQAPTIAAVTNYTREGFNGVSNRQIQLDMKIKYKAEFLGIDGLLPDPHTILSLWVSFQPRKTASGTELVMTLTRARMQTHVPAPTSGFISAETINRMLKDDVLNNVIGKPQVMGTVPSTITVLSVKVMPNGDLNTYIAPL